MIPDVTRRPRGTTRDGGGGERAASPNTVRAFTAAMDTHTSAGELARLARNTDANVRIMVARNKNTDAATLELLATDGHAGVRQMVADRPELCDETLITLARDVDECISLGARKVLRTRKHIGPDVWASFPATHGERALERMVELGISEPARASALKRRKRPSRT